VANAVVRARDIGGTAACTRAHSVDSFLFSASMSCSMESSRTGLGVMMVVVMIAPRAGELMGGDRDHQPPSLVGARVVHVPTLHPLDP
jgi:hypothetical protein